MSDRLTALIEADRPRGVARTIGAIGLALLWTFAAEAQGQPRPQQDGRIYPTAVLRFEERGEGIKDYGSQVADILFAQLASDPHCYLVDRQDLDKILAEQAVNLSGVVRPDQAARVGQLTGAKLLVTGSVFQVGDHLYLVAKLVSTETSRVAGTSVKGQADELASLAEKLAVQVAEILRKEGDKLVPAPAKTEDHVAKIKERLGDRKRPALRIEISERHIGQPAIDPAAETEFILLARQTGFPVIDPKEGRSGQAQVWIRGEGFSELAGQLGRLSSVKARVEVTAIDRASGKILAADRQTTVVVDTTEQIAGKKALQQAAAALAERLLPKLVQLSAPDAGKER